MFKHCTTHTLGFIVIVAMVGLAAPAWAQVLPLMSDPSPGSTLTTSTVTFTGGHAAQTGEQHWLTVETTPNAKDIFHASLGTGHTQEVSGLPTTGTLYVRYWTYTPVAGWAFQAHTYTMNVDSGAGGSAGSGDTANHTLRWDRILDSTNGDANGCNSDRFKCVMGGAAVVDLETGLVWDRSPMATGQASWQGAISHCATRQVGGRLGWELPLRNQLASLVDRNNSLPTLPTGHPFLTVPTSFSWSATVDAGNLGGAWGVNFSNGIVGSGAKGGAGHFAWCVRGGQAYAGENVTPAP